MMTFAMVYLENSGAIPFSVRQGANCHFAPRRAGCFEPWTRANRPSVRLLACLLTHASASCWVCKVKEASRRDERDIAELRCGK